MLIARLLDSETVYVKCWIYLTFYFCMVIWCKKTCGLSCDVHFSLDDTLVSLPNQWGYFHWCNFIWGHLHLHFHIFRSKNLLLYKQAISKSSFVACVQKERFLPTINSCTLNNIRFPFNFKLLQANIEPSQTSNIFVGSSFP